MLGSILEIAAAAQPSQLQIAKKKRRNHDQAISAL